MQNKGFIYFEQIVEAIKNGYFNEYAHLWNNANDRAIVFYMYNNQAEVKDVAEYFGMDEEEVKDRIKSFAFYYDRLSKEIINHESFSKRGR